MTLKGRARLNRLPWVATRPDWRLGSREGGNLRPKIVYGCHDAKLIGHPGSGEIMDNARGYSWWSTVRSTYVGASQERKQRKSSQELRG